MEHIKDAFTEGRADAALAASIFHFKEIDIMDLKRYLKSQNIPVRYKCLFVLEMEKSLTLLHPLVSERGSYLSILQEQNDKSTRVIIFGGLPGSYGKKIFLRLFRGKPHQILNNCLLNNSYTPIEININCNRAPKGIS